MNDPELFMSQEKQPSDQEVQKWIRHLKQHQVSDEFTSRVMSEARSLMVTQRERNRFSFVNLIRWITGWRHLDSRQEGIPLIPVMTRIAMAALVLGIGISIWNNALAPDPDNLVTQDLEAVTRELASLETAFEWLESDPVQANLDLFESGNASISDISDSKQAWIGDLQQVQAIALEGIQPDEELLDLFGQSIP